MAEGKREEVKMAARSILERRGWSPGPIRLALEPTPDEAAERPAVSAAELNPEQCAAVAILHRDGWPASDIAEALGVPEKEVGRFLAAKEFMRQLLRDEIEGVPDP